MPIEPGDIVVRAGTVGASGYNFNVLPKFISEPYNHAGLALSATEVHHVESHGYETVSTASFFSADSADGGAVIRFTGPQALPIRRRAVQIARQRGYKKIPGNPFSTSDNLTTVNCNEFVHGLFQQAITELLAETRTTDRPAFEALTHAYTDAGGKVHELIAARDIEFTTYDLFGAPLVANAAEAVGRTQVDNPDVRVQFEGRLVTRNLYPDDWGRSWNPFKAKSYQDGFYQVAVLHTYTPNSFLNSPLFTLVERVPKGGK